MNQGDRVQKDYHRKRDIFTTASLINKFIEGCPIDEVYKKSTDCFDILLDLIEKPEVGVEISRLIKQPQRNIAMAAQKILNLILFNEKNNPFLSFGLSKNATSEEVKKRWKRLLVIYHPDRMSNQKGYGEIAKKINQVYREIEGLKNKIPQDYGKEVVAKKEKKIIEKEEINYPSIRYFYPEYLKYLPTFIIITAIAVAIFTIILMFIKI
jgi:hypothetical protein